MNGNTPFVLKRRESKTLVNGFIDEQGVSIYRACKIVFMSRSMYYYDHEKDYKIGIIN